MDNYLDVRFAYSRVAAVEDLTEGERIFLEIENHPIVIFSINGEFFATGDICSHDGGEIGNGELDGEEIICPRHGARFNIRNGKALTLPAVTNIPIYPVRVVDGYLEIGIPE